MEPAPVRSLSKSRAKRMGRITFGVRDNGSGISPEDLPRVFEPKFSTTTSGTGLGLAICKRLVESWGGTVRAESDVGVGTAVTFFLEVSGEQ